MTKAYTLAIVGGGIVGVATALTYQVRHPDASVILIEREDALSRHQTGRNSGVIHAGVYYAPGSLKAQYCRRGAEMTKIVAAALDVEFDVCGKLIVATDAAEVSRMQAIAERAGQNGVPLREISGGELAEIEPEITGVAGLLSPSSGICDYPALSAAMAARFETLGGTIRMGCRLLQLEESDDHVRLITDQGDVLASHMTACAGGQADRIAAMSGLADGFQIVPFRGEYYEVADTWAGQVNHLIYPVPDPSLPFLGVHLTRVVGNKLTVGPNAMLSLGRERYGMNLPHIKDLAEALTYPGFWKLMYRNRSSAAFELAGSLSKSVYLKRCQKYCPSLEAKDLIPWPTGIRAQAVGADGKMIDDFLLRETKRTTHVCNAPSPAATSAMPIAEHICAQIEKRQNADASATEDRSAEEAAHRLLAA